MRNVHRGDMRYVAAVGLAIGLATVGLIAVASAQAGPMVQHPNGENGVCMNADGTYNDCYTPAPVNLYPPSQVGAPAGGRDPVVRYPTGQNDVCQYADGTYNDCDVPAPVNLYPPSQVGAPAGGGEQPAMPTHEAGDEKK